MTMPGQKIEGDLEPELVLKIEQWALRKMMEMQQESQAVKVVDGVPVYTFTFRDWLQVINDVAPDAIARMLQAGAGEEILLEGVNYREY